MPAQPEHKPEPGQDDSVRWIRREAPPPESPPPGPSAPPAGLRERIRTIPRAWIVGGVVALLALALAVWATRGSTPATAPINAASQSIPLVTVLVPEFAPVTATVTFTGTIAARHDMPIGVEGEGGRIVAVYVEAGDSVKRGQLLAKLDQSVLIPQVNRLAAALEEARAQAALSEAIYRRALGVEAAGALSAEEIERRRAASVTDQARVKVAAAQLEEARARLERTEIRAPTDGLVLVRNAEVGQTATPGGAPLFRLAAHGEMEMRGQVAEQDLAQLEIGQSANVYFSGVPRSFPGRVRLLGAVIDPQTRLGEIRIALEPDPALRPGAFARGEVIVNRANRAILPQTAVLTDERGAYVFVVNERNEVERRPVRVASTVPNGIVIGEGLKGDERIVATAGGFLREGEQVAIAPGPAEQP